MTDPRFIDRQIVFSDHYTNRFVSSCDWTFKLFIEAFIRLYVSYINRVYRVIYNIVYTDKRYVSVPDERYPGPIWKRNHTQSTLLFNNLHLDLKM